MIERLRKRFIRIATLAVAGVLLLLCVTVNAANYISADRQLTQMLRMICDNQGMVPHFPPDGGKHGQKPDGPFTPYSTRYFVLRYNGDGDLEQADLTHIAAVSEGDTAQYLTAALRHGAGFGYTAGYKYYVVHTDTDRWMAVFLDCYQQMHAVVTFAWMSLAAMAVCVVLVYVSPCGAAFPPRHRSGRARVRAAEAVYHRRLARAQNAHYRHRHEPEGAGDGGRAAKMDRQGGKPDRKAHAARQRACHALAHGRGSIAPADGGLPGQ